MYDPSTMGVFESVKKTLRAMMIDRLDDLTTALNRDTYTSSLTSPALGAASVQIGDTDGGWDKDVTQILFTIASGSSDGSTSLIFDYNQVGGPGISRIYTEINGYIHIAALKDDTRPASQYAKGLAIDRISEWLFAVFNERNADLSVRSPASITLESQMMQPTGSSDYDELLECKLTQISPLLFTKGFQDTEFVYGVRAIHTGRL